VQKFYTIMLCCMLSAASFGCDTKPLIAPELVGTWQYEDTQQGVICFLRFRLDGTFDGYLGKKEKQITFAGTWGRKADRILYTYKQPSPGKDEDKIIAIERACLIIQARDGTQRRYLRINDKKK
jgi:hypothetical protein